MPELSTFQRYPETKLPPLAQALVIRELRGDPPVAGAALVSIRRAVTNGTHDEHPAAQLYRAERKRIRALKVADMPPSKEDLWLLIEAVSQIHFQIGHGAAWETIGVSPNTGREYLTRASSSVDWPLWFTLRHAALGR